MNKPASLRAALAAAIPSLAADPERLAVFIDHGAIAATGTRSLAFEYRYVVNVILLDFAGDADTVMIALVEWARANQPDLVTNVDEREHGITFEADILNHSTLDLSIKMRLTESVAVLTAQDGQRTVTHVDDARKAWWAGALLARLTPAARRAVLRDIARELRRSQQARIAAQHNPDDSTYEPRKARAVRGQKKLSGKRGRIRRAAMFVKLRTARLLRLEVETTGLAIGGVKYHYPARVLLGFTDADRQMIRDRLLAHLAS
ncbi:hypothetical protein DFQ28_009317 [Apophysomyces sp. BC1034]|nr:hypothetical protein DFQ30_009115 [Apophysomyces sp. BC1015]KAG0192365.1 hypothetical protein DFQ28_009317 [Apophysomyces sp. BC1034]